MVASVGRRVVVDQASVRFQFGGCSEDGRTARKSALVLLASVPQHVLSQSVFGVEGVVALGADEAAFPARFPGPCRRRRRARALLLMGVQVRSSRERHETLSARKRPLSGVTPDVVPQRYLRKGLLAHGAGIFRQGSLAARILVIGSNDPTVKSCVKDKFRLRIR